MKLRRASLKRVQAAVAAAAMLVPLFQMPVMEVSAAHVSKGDPSMEIWFDEPVSQGTRIPGKAGGFGTTEEDDYWQQLTLPIGNGSIGANIYGEISREKLTFNEKTLWNGGPSSSRLDYDGGNKQTASNGQAMSEVFKQVQGYYKEGNDQAANELAGLLTGESSGYGAYQSWGDLYLDYGFQDDTYSQYSRNLDLLQAVSNVDFVKGGTKYHREYFISYPDQVMAVKLTAEGQDKMNVTISFPIDNAEDVAGRNLGKDVTTKAEGSRLTVSGQMQDNQLLLNGQVLVAQTGGGKVEPSADKQSLKVTGASEIVLYVAADTNYANEYPVYRTDDTAQTLDARVASLVDRAWEKGYDLVKSAHLADYKNIFDRVSLDLGQGTAVTDKTTDAVLKAYREGTADDTQQRLLETLLFQYGRYLTIASSRAGDLPSNLQGVWQNRVGDANRVPWGSDYHMNVNLQMNYWPTYSTNMLECATPIVDYINSLKEPGQVTAQTYFGVTGGGFTAHTQNTPFGWTCPGWDFSWGWSPAALPWILQNCYEYYEYSGDVEYLRTQIYPLLKESALLYDQILIEKDGRLVSAPAYSPEHGPISAGNTYEQSLIWQLYEDAIHSAEVLGVDQDKAAAWKETQSRLNPIEIGDSGQIKEWYTETTLGSMGSAGHRHMSHLLGLFPGDLISVDNAEYMEAAIVSLKERGYSSTGWGVGQRINSWARTGQGDGAYKSIQSLMKEGIYPNLWDSHAPFQIDGNFGYTSGVAEILMQSNMGYINILPSLPSVWGEGHVSGLVARGNFEVDIDWAGASPYSVGITSRNGEVAAVHSENIAMAAVTDNKGNTVEYTSLTPDRISFPTKKGEKYTITNIPARGAVLSAPENLNAVRADADTVDLTWDPVSGEDITYTVYRKIESGDTIKLAEGLTEAAYTDGGALEILGTIKYQVQAVAREGIGQIAGQLSDAVSVTKATDTFGMVDDRDAAITYTGTWGTWGEDGLYNRTSTFVEAPAGTETAEMSFKGTGIKIFATVNRDRGQADVYIDGEKHGTADSYASSKTNFKEIYSVEGLEEGTHTIKLHITNQKNPSSTKGKFEFDAFEVLNENKAISQVTVKSENGILVLGKQDSTLQMKAEVETGSSNKAVTWSAEPSSLASIDENGLLKVGSASGMVTVKAVSVQDPSKSGSLQVAVSLPSSVPSEPVLDNGTVVEFNVPGPENNGGGTLNQEGMEWTGSWGTWGGEEGHYNKDKVDGLKAGSTVSIHFTGAKIDIYGASNRTFSGYGVLLDDVSQGDVSGNGQNDAKNVLLSSHDGLEDKEHTLILTVLSANGNEKIALDYYKVYRYLENPGAGKADKTALQEILELHGGKYPELFTPESFAPFEAAYDQALAVMNDLDAEEEEAAAAVAGLEGAVSGLVPVKPAGPGLPQDPAVSAIGVESTTLMLIWPKTEEAVKYRIAGPDGEIMAETAETYCRISGLFAGTEYTFTVSAVNRADAATDYPPCTVSTANAADVTAPDKISGLAWDRTSGKITWQPSPSEDTVIYEIWVNGRKTATIDKNQAMEYEMGDLEAGSYTVSVFAADLAGNKSVPVNIMFTVEEPPVSDSKITGLAEVREITAVIGTSFEALSLPQKIIAFLDNGTEAELEVTWSKGEYQADKVGTYVITGECKLTAGIMNPQGIRPQVTVNVIQIDPEPSQKPDITSVQSQNLTVAYGTPLREVLSSLPQSITAQITDSQGSTEEISIRVNWQANDTYDGFRSGRYVFAGIIGYSEDYTNSTGITVPAEVTVSEKGSQEGGEGGSSQENSGASLEKEEITVDWNKTAAQTEAMLKEINGQTGNADGKEKVLNIVAGSNASVPSGILNQIKGKPAVIAFHTGNKLTFSINGKDVPVRSGSQISALNLKVLQGDGLLPAELTSQKTKGSVNSRQIEMTQKGFLGMLVNMHLDMGRENAGYYGNLYQYDSKNGRLEYLGYSKINENGQVMFGITQGAGFLVTVTKDMVKERAAEHVYQVKSGDTIGAIAKRLGRTIADMMAWNPQLENVNKIKVNQKLNIR